MPGHSPCLPERGCGGRARTRHSAWAALRGRGRPPENRRGSRRAGGAIARPAPCARGSPAPDRARGREIRRVSSPSPHRGLWRPDAMMLARQKGGRAMPQTGRIAFGKMEAVTFGRRAAEALPEEARRYEAERVFLMVSGTLNRDTDEIAKVRRALGNRYAGIFDRTPPHTPRGAVIDAAAAAREAGADLIATIGGGSVTDGAKAVQLCLANDIRTAEALDSLRPVAGPDGALGPPPCNGPAVRQITVPTTLSAGEFSAISGVTDERRRVKELFRHPQIIPPTLILDPAVTVHTPEWLWLSTGVRAVDHCVEGICSGEANPFAHAPAPPRLA